MGADYISLGATIDKRVTLTPEQTRDVVREFLPAIKENFLKIDPSGRFDDMDASDDDIVDTIAAGATWLKTGEEWSLWKIPGADENLRFLVSGGMSWGDPPFEEYDGAVMASDAADVLPDLGRRVGILGGGIRLDYASATSAEAVAEAAAE